MLSLLTFANDFFVDRQAFPASLPQQRVALVAGSYDMNVDGVALTLNRLVAHLIRRGHEVLVIVAATGHRKAVLNSAGAPIVRVPSLPLPIWSEVRRRPSMKGKTAYSGIVTRLTHPCVHFHDA